MSVTQGTEPDRRHADTTAAGTDDPRCTAEAGDPRPAEPCAATSRADTRAAGVDSTSFGPEGGRSRGRRPRLPRDAHTPGGRSPLLPAAQRALRSGAARVLDSVEAD